MTDTPQQGPPPLPAPPAWDADINERIAGMNAALTPLLAKYELGLGALPRILPDGRTVADPILVSMRKAPESAAPQAPAPKTGKKGSALSSAE